MSKAKTATPVRLSLQAAYEAEQARRAAERQAKIEAEQVQQEKDLARAEELEGLLRADADFLGHRGLTLDRRRYTVSLDHERFRIAAYFEAGKAVVTSADKRSIVPGAAPRKQQDAETLAETLGVMAAFLADETR